MLPPVMDFLSVSNACYYLGLRAAKIDGRRLDTVLTKALISFLLCAMVGLEISMRGKEWSRVLYGDTPMRCK